jgi:hypothetical protein
VSHSAVDPVDTVTVLCDVLIEAEEGVKHQTYNTTYQKEMSVLLLKINIGFALKNEQDRQCKCRGNNEARASNHCCREKE